MRVLEKAVRILTDNNWVVRKTIWPYPEGYGVYNPATRTVLETGISKEQAQQICDEMNREAGQQ